MYNGKGVDSLTTRSIFVKEQAHTSLARPSPRYTCSAHDPCNKCVLDQYENVQIGLNVRYQIDNEIHHLVLVTCYNI